MLDTEYPRGTRANASTANLWQVTTAVNLIPYFLPEQRYAMLTGALPMALCLSVSVSLSEVVLLKRLYESRELPSTCPTRC